jgi:hypothetical protein
MKRKAIRNALLNLIAGCCLVASASRVRATPVSGRFVNDARGDAIADQLLGREIGDVAMFPAIDAIAYHTHHYNQTIGIADDGVQNDWSVHITNVSGQSWINLYFVADLGVTIGNSDGKMEDQIGASGVFTDAFRIDASGTNANLLSESKTQDGILEPGEDWLFAVSNFGTGINQIPPTLITPGIFAGSSTPGLTSGNASILATPAPEPTALGVVALITSALLRRPRHRRKMSAPALSNESHAS